MENNFESGSLNSDSEESSDIFVFLSSVSENDTRTPSPSSLDSEEIKYLQNYHLCNLRELVANGPKPLINASNDGLEPILKKLQEKIETSVIRTERKNIGIMITDLLKNIGIDLEEYFQILSRDPFNWTYAGTLGFL
ncbi:10917_t:CDS:2, partial [Ambispora leptoticha]